MEHVLLHCCCAPCSLSCIDPLRAEGIEPTAFWYNPNIHPWKEYEARRDCLLQYAPTIGMEVVVREEYGLREFVRAVSGDIDHRCQYCYEHRLEETARFAAEHGFPAFTSTLLASTYQDHDAIAAAAKRFADRYGVTFLYRDFRPNFREGNRRARELGFYMQKYCGCVFSEQDRYQKAINRDRAKFDALLNADAFRSDDLQSVLSYLRRKFGADLFRDGARVFAMLTDLSPSLKGDANIVRQLIDKGVWNEVEQAVTSGDASKQDRAFLRTRAFLSDELYLREDKASDVLRILRGVYGLTPADADDASNNAAQSTSNTSKGAQSTSTASNAAPTTNADASTASNAAHDADAQASKHERPPRAPDWSWALEHGRTGNLEWALDRNGVLTIAGWGPIPDYRFRAPWWKRRKQITSVVMERGVTAIGNEAFHGCKQIQSVTIPDTVIRIGDWAFDSCTALESVTIPNSVKTIGDWAFERCHGLTSVEIPDSVRVIGHAAFSHCKGLTNISIPDSVQTIESLAFFDCDKLLSITIPAATQVKHGLLSTFDVSTAIIRRM